MYTERVGIERKKAVIWQMMFSIVTYPHPRRLAILCPALQINEKSTK